MPLSKTLVLVLFVVVASRAQSISVGVIAGAPFTDVVNRPQGIISICTNGCADNSGRYTVGPSVRISLPLKLRIEVDALYRPYGFTEFGGDGYSASVSGQEWRFPVLLQYRLGGHLLVPFVELGASFEHLSSLSDDVRGNLVANLSRRSVAGLVAGGGVDLNLPIPRFHLSGELRYTRQASSWFENASELNQAEVLFGVRF